MENLNPPIWLVKWTQVMGTNLVGESLDLRMIIEKSDGLMQYLHKPFDIQLISDADNKVFKIKGDQEIIAKVCLRGWGGYEFETLKKLSLQNYNVPNPIIYISLQEDLDEKWAFGNLPREVGILFYTALEGQPLDQQLTKINITKALNFLKGLHENKSLVDNIVDDYQKIEIARGLRYLESFAQEELVDQMRSALEEYENVEVDFCFIHGGPRLEHFILKENQIGMIDFEGACIGDRFKDLGIFFTDLLFSPFQQNELIKMYFKRNLSAEETARLKFFELRTLLVKMKYDPSEDVLKRIQQLIDYE